MVTDGGLETDLIFHHGVDLAHFAAFPLLDSNHGRALLAGYYDGYAAIARRAGAGLVLESPTWRASPDWGARLGYSLAELVRANNGAIALAGGLPLAQAISEVDGHGGPDYFMVNCAHPTHIAPRWPSRAPGVSASSACATTPPPKATPSSTRPPASTMATPACSPTSTAS